jgi:hypothetical protein
MCIGKSPSMPTPPPPPPPPQAATTPAPTRQAATVGTTPTQMSGGTLLTGTGGVANSSLNLGGKTLLGQ